MSFFTVIVPVYNAATFIERCIDSVRAQIVTAWKLVLVDDGSTDNSYEICRRFAGFDERIVVFHQTNQGPGMARNLGLKYAEGDYVCFLDADDYLANDYLLTIDNQDEDVVFFNLQNVSQDGSFLGLDRMSINSSLTKDHFIRQQMTGKISWGAVRKSVKIKLLKDNNICFSRHKIGEEALYSFLVLYYANTVTYVDKAIYFRVVRNDSQSHSPVLDPWGPVALNLKYELIEKGLYSEFADTINAFVLTASVRYVSRLAKKYSFVRFKKEIRTCISFLKKNIDKRHSIDYGNMEKRVFMLGALILHKSYFLFWFIMRFR